MNSKKVNDKCGLRSLSMGAATLFVCLSTLPAKATIPGTATATAKVGYNIQSPGWSLGDASITDDGNLYTEGLPSSPSATATVNWGSTPKSRSGTVTYKQQFVWSSADPIGELSFKPSVDAAAQFDRQGQHAHAKAQFQMPFAGVTLTAEATAQEPELPASDSFSLTASITPTVTIVNVIAIVEADASTP